MAYVYHQYYTNKYNKNNQIKNSGSPLLASPFGAKIKNSNLRLKLAGEPSQRASQQRHFLTGGETGIRTLDTLADMPVFETGAFNHSAISPCIPSVLSLSNLNLQFRLKCQFKI